MDRRHQPPPRPRNRVHCVEPLEERWLLSGLQAPPAPADEPQSPVAEFAPTYQASAPAVAAESRTMFNGAVEVVELGAATEDDDSDVETATSMLPTEIVAAFDARFPGAELVEAELSTEDGTAEYDLTAEWDGHLIGAKFTADGTILEMEQAVIASELPEPVLDWVRRNFPGAVIGEANLVTEAGAESYELLIATSGQQEFEATLRVQGVGAPNSIRVQEEVGDHSDSVATTVNATLKLSGSFSPSDTNSQAAPLVSETSEKPKSDSEAKHAAAAHEPSPEQGESEKSEVVRAVTETNVGDAEQGYSNTAATDAPTARVRGGQVTNLVDAFRALVESVASAGSMAWLPQIAGVLSDVLPMDVAAVERGLQQLLDEFDSLAEEFAGDTAVTSTAALRLAVIAGLITGAELVIFDSRKPNREPVLASSAANSSWRWILGAAPPKRS